MVDQPELRARRTLGLNARQARLARGWTQEFAAEKFGCSVQQFRRLEGAATNSTIDFIARLAAFYQVELPELLTSAGPWKNPVRGRPPANGPLSRR